MTPLSLRARLLLVATLVLFIFLGLMGIVLDQAFRRSAEEGVSERLLLHIYGLLAATEEIGGELFLPEALQEPDFNRMGTGLYALVLDGRSDELWRSASALDVSLTPASLRVMDVRLDAGEPRFGRVQTADGRELFYLAYRVLWQGDSETATPYTFVALQTLDTYLGEVSGFRNNLWGWLVGVVVVLLGVQAAVMSWGLAPLRRLANDLKQIEDGRQDYLEGRYPEEIDGVTRNLNLLLASERQQREKYRTTMADLAHSLKTPLAILKSAAATDSDADVHATVDEQVARMDEIVSYQLGRAMASSPAITRRALPVAPVVDRLIAAMEKVYASRKIVISRQGDEGRFYGDERDLMELLGNLVDNACKHGETRVEVTVQQSGERGELTLTVDDDGPGIAPADRARVMQRGERLDSRSPGQGIGLAVVADIIERYGGRWEMLESGLGGLRFVAILP